MAPDLAVADGAHGRGGLGHSRIGAQPAHFVDEAHAQHRAEAFVDAAVQVGALRRHDRHFDKLAAEPLPCRHRRAAPVRGDRTPGGLQHFEGALDARAVGAAHLRGGSRISTLQLLVQRWPAAGRSALYDALSQFRLRRRQIVQAVAEGAEVEHRAAHQKRRPAGGEGRLNSRICVGNEARHRIGFAGLGDIHQRMRVFLEHLPRWLRGADVHAAIDHRRIHAHEVHVRGVVNGERGVRLAGGGRAQQQRDRALGRHCPRRNRLSRAARGCTTKVGRPWLHWPAFSVVSMLRSRAFISGSESCAPARMAAWQAAPASIRS